VTSRKIRGLCSTLSCILPRDSSVVDRRRSNHVCGGGSHDPAGRSFCRFFRSQRPSVSVPDDSSLHQEQAPRCAASRPSLRAGAGILGAGRCGRLVPRQWRRRRQSAQRRQAQPRSAEEEHEHSGREYERTTAVGASSVAAAPSLIDDAQRWHGCSFSFSFALLFAFCACCFVIHPQCMSVHFCRLQHMLRWKDQPVSKNMSTETRSPGRGWSPSRCSEQCVEQQKAFITLCSPVVPLLSTSKADSGLASEF